ncbi:MAG: RecB family exonuclease [Limisphaerales bacterium]
MTALAPVERLPVKTPKAAPTIEELSQTVSASRLGCWLQCRLKFYFRYVAAIKKPPTVALHVGKVFHSVLQAWNMARWRKEPFETEKFQKLFEGDWEKEQADIVIKWGSEEDGERQGTWNMLQTYFAGTPIKADEKPEAVEVPIEADLSEHGLPRLIGIIDLIRAGGTIVDFKTSGKTPDAAQVQHLHELQLSCYGVLYRDATGKREAGFELHHLVKLKTPKLVVTAIGAMTEGQKSRLFRSMESYMDGLARKDFVPSPGFHCAACEYFGECRSWKGNEP